MLTCERISPAIYLLRTLFEDKLRQTTVIHPTGSLSQRPYVNNPTSHLKVQVPNDHILPPDTNLQNGYKPQYLNISSGFIGAGRGADGSMYYMD